jgi:hypothetical protein
MYRSVQDTCYQLNSASYLRHPLPHPFGLPVPDPCAAPRRSVEVHGAWRRRAPRTISS